MKGYKSAVAAKEIKSANLIRNVQTLDDAKLSLEATKAFSDKEDRDAALLKAYDEHKLQSKALIKKARALKRSAK